ncbi:DUF6114 domain-containing protein [Halorientalis brevis]|uniref:DUF6114 domain-containing protein n=1 Tax=Halorientalis brevis TaxID=1126241 RepID=A0ABD6CBX0_9EURY
MSLSSTQSGDGAVSETEASMTGDETITFGEWRATRPFWGALALIAGGLVIAWPSLQFLLQTSMLQSQSVVSLGVVVGALLVFLGVGVLTRPEYSTAIGLAGLVLATISFPVAFGGLLVGMVVASVGSILCFAWTPADENVPVAE